MNQKVYNKGASKKINIKRQKQLYYNNKKVI